MSDISNPISGSGGGPDVLAVRPLVGLSNISETLATLGVSNYDEIHFNFYSCRCTSVGSTLYIGANKEFYGAFEKLFYGTRIHGAIHYAFNVDHWPDIEILPDVYIESNAAFSGKVILATTDNIQNISSEMVSGSDGLSTSANVGKYIVGGSFATEATEINFNVDYGTFKADSILKIVGVKHG